MATELSHSRPPELARHGTSSTRESSSAAICPNLIASWAASTSMSDSPGLNSRWHTVDRAFIASSYGERCRASSRSATAPTPISRRQTTA